MRSLRAAALGGGRWSAAENIFLQLISIGLTAFLARALSPVEFGVIAATTIVLGLFEVLTRFGLGAVIVQRAAIDERTSSTLFWASCVLSAGSALAVLLCSGVVSNAFGQPAAAPLIAASGLALCAGLLRSIPEALLARALRFRSRALVRTAGFLLGSVITVILIAALDWGVWAVIVGRIADAVLQLLGTIVVLGWRPRMVWDGSVIKDSFSLNAAFFGSNFASYITKNLDYWIVGRFADPNVLGVYYIAYVLPTIIRQRLTWAMQGVLFPVFSRMAGDLPRLSKSYLSAMKMATLVTTPVMTGLALLAPEAVHFAFGPQWTAAATPVRILALAACIDAYIPLAVGMFDASGRPHQNITVSIVRAIVLLIGFPIALTVNDFVLGISFVVLVGSFAAATTSQVLTIRYLQLSIGDLVRVMSVTAVPTAVLIAAVSASKYVLNSTISVGATATIILVGACAYCAAGLAARPREFRQLGFDIRMLVAGGR